MQNKKIMVVVFALVFFSFIFYLAVFYKQKNLVSTDRNAKEQSTKVDIKDASNCNFSTEEDIYKKVSEDKNGDACSCLKEDKKISECVDNLNDSLLYERILSETDLSICDGIKNEEVKSACINVGKARKEYLDKLEKENVKDESTELFSDELKEDEK